MLNLHELKQHEFKLKVELALIQELIALRTSSAGTKSDPTPARKVRGKGKKKRKTPVVSEEARARLAQGIREYHRKKREALNAIPQEAPPS
jgi:site-specific recombinase XerD